MHAHEGLNIMASSRLHAYEPCVLLTGNVTCLVLMRVM
jgi:hypothetical protein